MTVTLYQGDCLDILPTLAPGSYSSIVTDPPYGLAHDASHKKYKDGLAYEDADWDIEPYDPSPIIALGVPTILWGANCYASRLPDFPGWLCWVKVMRDGAKIRQSDMELAWTNFLKRPRVKHHLWIGFYRDSESGKRNLHPTQKPVEIMKWCISLISKPGDTILDPYMGSASTGVAAIEMGRHFIGIEKEPDYFAKAQKRLDMAMLQLPLPMEIAE